MEACELMLQDHFNKMANNVDTVNLGFPNVSLNTDTLDDVGDLGGANSNSYPVRISTCSFEYLTVNPPIQGQACLGSVNHSLGLP
jgi:hypothetical protein